MRGVSDPEVDPLVPGGRELAALARTAATRQPDPTWADAVAHRLSPAAAVDAAAVAGAFEQLNRVVDATGLPVGPRTRERDADLITQLGLAAMPHAAH